MLFHRLREFLTFTNLYPDKPRIQIFRRDNIKLISEFLLIYILQIEMLILKKFTNFA